MLYEIWRRASELIFPSWCELCQEQTCGDQVLCAQCEGELVPHERPYCLRCAEPHQSEPMSNTECANCRGVKYYFDFAVAAFTLDSQLLEVVHVLKYARGIYLAPQLGRLMARALVDERLMDLDLSEWVVTSVPLHHFRERKRYFNQSAELARHFAKSVGVVYSEMLKRVLPTPHQARLKRAERAKNVKGCFEVKDGDIPPNVFLVDDVFTTGATVNECARMMRRAGVQRVIVLVLGRK